MRFARAWPVGALLAMLVLSVAMNLATSKPANFTGGDAPDYLATAYHLAHHHVFARDPTAAEVAPGIGREPGYPLFAAALMSVDPGLGTYTPECARHVGSCDLARFRLASLANLMLVELSGVLLFLLAFRVTGSMSASLVAAGYTLLNLHMNRFWQDPVSDRLAMFLVVATMLAFSFAWGTRHAARWSFFATALSALTLTKAVYLPYSVLAGLAAFLWVFARPTDVRSKLRILGLVSCVYAVLVGGWVLRNFAVSGELRITDNRAGLMLSTREALDHMTPAQYVASFIYWTRGPGPGLAQRLFGPELTAPLGLEEPGGFFLGGQDRYNGHVEALATAEHIDILAASARMDREVIGEISEHPLAYAALIFPVLYRGFWIDEFALIGIPALFFATWRSWRRGETLKILLLSVGIYNEVFHALISLNIPRFQITAMPSVAIAVALAFSALARVLSRKARAIDLAATIVPVRALARSNALIAAEASATPVARSTTIGGHDPKPG